MSACIVPRAHIATLAAFALGGTSRIGNQFGSMLEVANKLAVENAASVSYRYQEWITPDSFSGDADVWRDTRMDLLLQPLTIIKAVSCLEYQSCEHPTWEASEACKILERIRSRAIDMLPGYDKAEGWTIKDKQS